MVMQAMHSGKGSRFIKFFFFSLLVMAAGGLVLTDVGGFFSGGVGQSDVAVVGKEKIPAVSFDRSLRRSLARNNIPVQQAYQLGLVDQILNGEIRRSLMQQVAEEGGIVVSRDVVAKKIHELVAPQMNEGDNPQEIFERVLASQGFTENEFVKIIAAESAASLLAKAVQNKYVGASDVLAQDLYLYNNEARNIRFITFLDGDYKGTKQPEDAQLETLYNAMIETYAKPEARDIIVAILDEAAIKASVALSDADVRAAYDADVEAYAIPEERILEQVIIESEEDAKAIAEKAQDGTALKEVLETVTGKTEALIAAQAFRKEGLVAEMADPVFGASTSGGVYGPFQSPLGWHVIKLVEIKAPHTQSFETVKERLGKELAETAIADRKFALAGEVDERLVAGETLEAIAADTDLEIVKIAGVTTMGAMADRNHPLDQFGDDQAEVTKLAFEYEQGEASPVTELTDGRLVSVWVDKVTPKSYTPFEEVKNALRTRWVADNQRADNRTYVSELLKTAVAEEKDVRQIAKDEEKSVLDGENLKRSEEAQSPMTEASIAQIFNAPQGQLFLLEIENGVALAEVTKTILPAASDKVAGEIAQMNTAMSSASENETSLLFFEHKRKDYNIQVNQAVLARLYGALPADDAM